MMRSRRAPFLRAAVLSAAVASSLALPARAAFDQTDVGARARAMGSAFVALADDSSAVSWNPASLATLSSREIGLSYEDRFGLGLVGVSYFSLAYPGMGPGGFGFSWLRTAAAKSVQDLQYSEDTYSFGYGGNLWRGVSLGTTVNFHQLVSEIKGSGFSADLSAKVPFWKDKFGAGFLWRNAVQTTLRYDSGFKEPFPRSFQGGVFLAPFTGVKVTYDVEKVASSRTPRSHAGLEWAGEYLALRGGLAQSQAAGFDWVYTAGATVKAGSLALDYAYEQHFDLGGTQLVSVRLMF